MREEIPEGTMDIEQIKRSHQYARPKSENPAWVNTHRDLDFVLREYDRISAINRELLAALEQWKQVEYCRTELQFTGNGRKNYEYQLNIASMLTGTALAKAKGE